MYCGNLERGVTSSFYIVAFTKYEVSVSLPKEYFPQDSKRYWHDDSYCCTFYPFCTNFRWAELSGRRLVLRHPELLETGSFKTNSFSASRDCLHVSGAACVCCFRTMVFIKSW